jgi:hypothetical protein
MRALAFLVGGLVCVAVPKLALAQDASQPVYTAPPTTQPPPTGQPNPNAPPAVVVAPEPPKDYFPRFRWGIWFVGGPYFYGGAGGGVGGVNVRMGVAINELFSVYGQVSGLLGGGAGVSLATGTTSASALVAANLAAMADLTLGNLFFIAAGPELVSGIVGSTRVDPKTSKEQGAAGAFFGISARTGLALGSTSNPKHRRAFTFGLNMEIILTPFDPVIAPMLGLGYDDF